MERTSSFVACEWKESGLWAQTWAMIPVPQLTMNEDIDVRDVEHLNKTVHMKLSTSPSPGRMLLQSCLLGDLVSLLTLTCCIDIII